MAAEYNDEVHLTKDDEDAYRTALEAVKHGRPEVIVAGGDDTVRQVLYGMYGPDSPLRPGPNHDQTRTCLGIVPTGTFNNFGAHLGLPRDIEAAFRLAHEGSIRWIDLGWIDGMIFTENIGLGIDVEAWKGFRERPSVWWRLWDGLKAVLRALYYYHPRKVRLRIDGEISEHTIFHLTVANSERFCAAFSIAPHAKLDDGMLDVCIFPRRSKLAFLATLPLVFFGQHTRYLRDVKYIKAREVLIESNKPYVVRVDGKLSRRLPVRIRALAGALPIRIGT